MLNIDDKFMTIFQRLKMDQEWIRIYKKICYTTVGLYLINA